MGHNINIFRKFNTENIQLFIEYCFFTNKVLNLQYESVYSYVSEPLCL